MIYVLLSWEEKNFEASRKKINNHRRVHTRLDDTDRFDEISGDFQKSEDVNEIHTDT